MKSIEITGKRNIDKIDKIDNPQRKECLNWELSEDYFTYKKQIEIINKLYLEDPFEKNDFFKNEINKKLTGYKYQDIKKKTINISKFISLEQTIEKLMEIKLYCFYCKEKCELIYKDIFAKKQWTLDRINNIQGHNWDNVVISCLECNIKRGDMDSERFKRGKQIQIVRKQF